MNKIETMGTSQGIARAIKNDNGTWEILYPWSIEPSFFDGSRGKIRTKMKKDIRKFESQ